LVSFIYVYVSFIYTINYPINIDDVIICISDLILTVEGEISYLEYLFKRKNDNPTIVLRLINLINFLITGKIDFSNVPIVSNILVAMFSFYIAIKHKHLKFSFVIPLLLMIPTAQYIYWSSAATTYIFSFIFLYLSLSLIQKIKQFNKLILLFILITLLTYSFANGFLGCILIILFSFHQVYFADLDKKICVIIVLMALIHIVVFLSGYEGGMNGLDFNLMKLNFVFAFCGNLYKYIDISWVSASVLSFLLILYLSILFFRNYNNSETIIFFFMVGFVIVSGIVVAISRCRLLNLCNPFFIRYEIYGVMFFLFTYFIIIKIGKNYVSYLFILLLILPLPIKSIQNYFLLQKDKYYFEEARALGYFRKKYKIKAFNKDFVTIIQDDYQKAIDKRFIDEKPELSLINEVNIQSLDINNETYTADNMKLDKVLKKNGLMIIKGHFLHSIPSALYLNTKGKFYSIEFKYNPNYRDKEGFGFYLILPEMRKNKYKIIAR